MNRLLFILIPLLLISLLFFAWTARQPVEIELNLLLTGILQGHIEPWTVEVKGKTVETHLTGGLAFLKTTLDGLRSAAVARGARVLCLSTGDDLAGTSQSFYTQGRSVVSALNLLGLDAMSLGNREFDFGREVLAERLAETTFPVLAGNVRQLDGAQPPHIIPWREFDLQGLRVGVTGMAPPTTGREAKTSNIKGLTFTDEVSVVHEILPLMKESGCELLVVITQRDMEKEFADLQPLADQADVVIALDYNHQYTQPVRLGRTWLIPYFGLSKGSEVTEARLIIDRVTRQIKSGTLYFSRVNPGKVQPDMKMAQCIADFARRIDRIKGRVIGQLKWKLERPYGACASLGNFICDIMRLEASAEIALQNSGSIRADLPPGPVNVGMVYDVLPFDNDIVAMDLTGQDLLDIISHAIRERRGLVQISGGQYDYQQNAEGKSEPGTILFAGSAVDPQRIYRVATNDFMAGGGGGYGNFRNGKNVTNHGRLRQVVTDWIEQKGFAMATDEIRFQPKTLPADGELE